ncbi:RluA family pseudouridine synthase [Chloroflexus sp.]|uniref:RluA family pseudouridine synthase n=1 Tax=Chloroflexus sp. TaxID=1904827 RepID=UPI00261756CA|nr:RluA family pseudouridine synthase [uncultured Chloroflexus sp.]
MSESGELEWLEADERMVVVPPTATGERIDRFLAATLPDLSRAQVQRLIEQGLVLYAGRPARASQPLRPGVVIQVTVPSPVPTELVAEPIPLAVVYEDVDIAVINKPAGMVVHPAPGHPRGTLVNALLARYPDLAVGGEVRPGIVHRLDRDTSGLLVIARHDAALRALVEQQQARRMRKIYQALVIGHPPDTGTIDAPIGRDPRDRLRMAVVNDGRPARTHYRVLETFGDYSLLEVQLETGRTHQIRVHLRYLGYPIVGDPVYGPRRAHLHLERQFLHAGHLGLFHPRDGQWREYTAPLPPDLSSVLNHLRRITSYH